MESILYRDPELEASFSFSYYDFNSAVLVFSDDNDEAGVNDDEYIEIALEQPRISYGDDDDGSRDQELELRISFSSTSVPFFDINCNSNNSIGLSRTTVESIGNFSETVATPSWSSSSSSTKCSLSCSSGETCNWVAGTGPSRLTHDTIKRRVQLGAVNRPLSGFLSTLRTEIVEKEGTVPDENSRQMAIQNNVNKLQLLRSRKAAKMSTKSTNGGMMMRFLIKCRSINLRALLASFMKPYQVIKNSPQTQKKKKSKWLVQKEGANRERSKVFDINLDAIKGVIESVGSSFGWRDRRTNNQSCGNNTNNNNSLTILQQGNSYPAGENKMYARDNSIQDAIAHCKRSFGHPSEFSF